ncbi:MAG: hypothetical protein WC781_01065 [Candidatus Pacearchaeota archaeon]|jgi:hypothetical protein
MDKKVEVSLEAFGNKRLTSEFSAEELKKKNIGEIVNEILGKSREGEDKRTQQLIQTQAKASGGFTPSVGVGSPVRFQPVRLGEGIQEYIRKDYLDNEMVRISVLGNHVVGY